MARVGAAARGARGNTYRPARRPSSGRRGRRDRRSAGPSEYRRPGLRSVSRNGLGLRPSDRPRDPRRSLPESVTPLGSPERSCSPSSTVRAEHVAHGTRVRARVPGPCRLLSLGKAGGGRKTTSVPPRHVVTQGWRRPRAWSGRGIATTNQPVPAQAGRGARSRGSAPPEGRLVPGRTRS